LHNPPEAQAERLGPRWRRMQTRSALAWTEGYDPGGRTPLARSGAFLTHAPCHPRRSFRDKSYYYSRYSHCSGLRRSSQARSESIWAYPRRRGCNWSVHGRSRGTGNVHWVR